MVCASIRTVCVSLALYQFQHLPTTFPPLPPPLPHHHHPHTSTHPTTTHPTYPTLSPHIHAGANQQQVLSNLLRVRDMVASSRARLDQQRVNEFMNACSEGHWHRIKTVSPGGGGSRGGGGGSREGVRGLQGGGDMPAVVPGGGGEQVPAVLCSNSLWE
jgi:hypothetical protein